jgi:ribosomal protein S18 acetylase RimI-like enzyme
VHLLGRGFLNIELGLGTGHRDHDLWETGFALGGQLGCGLEDGLGATFMRSRWRMIGYPFSGEFYPEFLIVDEALRGQGIGGVLMDAMEAKARQAAVDRLTLDVAAKNTAGQRFYERRGMMTRVPDWPKGRFGRRFVPRMTKGLQ